MNKAILNTKMRHDFVLLFDVTDGNPNGDPDAGNQPRTDPETMHGLVTDICIKRKVRDFVAQSKKDFPEFKIYVESGAILNRQHERAYFGTDNEEFLKQLKSKEIKSTEVPGEVIDLNRSWMCANFYDIRMFGAVMSTGINCGQVRGPMQLTFGRSIDPVLPLDLSITRVAITKEGENKETEMGRKAIIPYGLYRSHGFYSVKFGEDTGVTSEDLEAFWDALARMWESDHSASRGQMVCQGLYVFSHEIPIGCAPSHKLFERIKISKKDPHAVVRSIKDYDIIVCGDDLPRGVHFTTVVC